MSEAKPIGGKLVTKPILFLAALGALGVFFVLKRFIFGLGSVTNLSDGYPWGIFIAYDVVVGTAIACGGYAMALVVYIANKGEFHAAVRPALLASMFGYTLAGVSVIFDIGRWWQFYNLFLPGTAHLHSVMFEIALCIALYCLVLWIEFTPSFLEKLKAKGFLKTFNRIMFFFIALGVLLPTMHQSSLGSLMLIAGRKLSPLWNTPLLPLLFLLSAIAMGYAMVMFESHLSAKFLTKHPETKMLGKLSALLPPLILAFLVLRFGDLIYRGNIKHAFELDYRAVVFWLENILYVVGVVMLMSKEKRFQARNQFVAAWVLLFAGAGYRFDAFLVAYEPTPGWNYFPSFSELSITLGLIAIELIAYITLSKLLPVQPAPSAKHA